MTPETAARFARLTLGHVEREYPNKLDHVMAGAEDARTPSELHPVFYGSFDWHSCVHGWWQLLRLTRLYPDLPDPWRRAFQHRIRADAHPRLGARIRSCVGGADLRAGAALVRRGSSLSGMGAER